MNPDTTTVPLRALAHARSGDKGSSANIGVLAYTEEGYQFLRGFLSETRVADYFAALGPERVTRYELPKLRGFNFVLAGVLAGGGSRSLRTDAQGKTLAAVLLEMRIELPEGLPREARLSTNQGPETPHSPGETHARDSD